MKRKYIIIVFSALLTAVPLLAEATRVDAEEAWPWEIHLITIPLVFFFGLAVGWALRDRKLADEEARREEARREEARREEARRVDEARKSMES